MNRTTRTNSKGLTDADMKFINAWYENNKRVKEAYLSLHPTASQGTAQNEGYKTLIKPCVAAYIREQEEESLKALGISAQKTLEKLAKLAYMNLEPDSKSPAMMKKVKNLGVIAISALDKVAKVQKMYAPDVVVNIEGDEYTGPMLMLPQKKRP